MTDAHRYSVTNFMGQLPRVLDDDTRMHALAYAIAKALGVHLNEIPLAEIYTRIDELPESLLDLLAYDFKIDWYNFDYPIAAKRNTVKTNYYVHRHLGTIGAVKAAILDVYPRSTVEEWFDYDGDPFCFRVVLEAGYPIIPVANTDILRALYTYKSLRSHLDGIMYRTTVEVGISVTCGWVAYWGRVTGTYPQRARHGRAYVYDIEVGTHAEGLVYTNPATDDLVAGTFPRVARQGAIYAEDLAVGVSAEGVVYQNPATGEIDAGVFPDISVQGSIESGMIDASASGEGLAYNTRYCGSTPGSLF